MTVLPNPFDFNSADLPGAAGSGVASPDQPRSAAPVFIDEPPLFLRQRAAE